MSREIALHVEDAVCPYCSVLTGCVLCWEYGVFAEVLTGLSALSAPSRVVQHSDATTDPVSSAEYSSSVLWVLLFVEPLQKVFGNRC